jgi:hypothetical protein
MARDPAEVIVSGVAKVMVLLAPRRTASARDSLPSLPNGPVQEVAPSSTTPVEVTTQRSPGFVTTSVPVATEMFPCSSRTATRGV